MSQIITLHTLNCTVLYGNHISIKQKGWKHQKIFAVMWDWGYFGSQGDFWLCLQTSGLVTTGRSGTSLVAQMVKNPPTIQETWVPSLHWDDPLEEGIATHPSILAWRIPMDRGAWQAKDHGVAESYTTE